MHFNIAGPKYAVYNNTAGEEIRTGVGVQLSKINNLKTTCVGGLEVSEIKVVCSPYEVQKIFSHKV
jgi:hypothetical protein